MLSRQVSENVSRYGYSLL